jgi:low temperature requirement protein LtrA
MSVSGHVAVHRHRSSATTSAVSTATPSHGLLAAVRREKATVTPLELFFDLVFVLALTQCTALMADQPTWEGLAKGQLVLGVLWWAWVGYAWLTSVIDPEEGAVRLVMFAAMAGLLVAALCVPEVFDDTGLLFACAYAVVRIAHIALFMLASRDDPEGWKLVPAHFAERHGLILIIALGESIVAIGVGAEAGVDVSVVVSAVLGIAIAASLWWLYFDIVALVAERRLSRAQPGREQNEIARDSFSYLHFPMVAGIVLVALGLKKTLEHPEDALKIVPAVALLGGTAIYLLAHVAFRWRNVHRFSWYRLGAAVVLAALVPVGVELPALATVGIVAAPLAALIAFETVHFAELRDRLRHQVAEH